MPSEAVRAEPLPAEALPTGRAASERQSPPTERVVAIINLLTAHPDRRFTLTDIIRQVDITKATCHVVLQTLAAAGYLVRHHDKTYTLGPALIAVGRVALKTSPVLVGARPEMEALSRQFGAVVSAVVQAGDELIVVERTGPDDRADRLQVGHRIPFVPPMGIPFIVWGEPGALERWLARSRQARTPADGKRWQRLMAAVRETGYGVEPMTATSSRVRALVGELADEQLSPSVRSLLASLVEEIGPAHYLPEDLTGTERLPVGVVYAPVLDPRGRAEVGIALNLFREMTPREIRRAGRALVAGAERLSLLLHADTAVTA